MYKQKMLHKLANNCNNPKKLPQITALKKGNDKI